MAGLDPDMVRRWDSADSQKPNTTAQPCQTSDKMELRVTTPVLGPVGASEPPSDAGENTG